jgi:EAL domain-containing protein (putative c-di-GMP-specific phosphodiesterase class I)
MVPPPEIVAVAHRTGKMRELTDNLIGQALAERAVWLAAGRELSVSVNVTPRDVSDASLVTRVAAALAETGTPASALVLEITESDVMKDPEHSLTVLEAVSSLGVRVSVDDFGTGYSSLAYLDQLPVDEVKIDQSFVRRLERESSDITIVRATVSLAHELGLTVVAEGVENDVARSLVRGLGVDGYQGFGLARPMPAGDVCDWLNRHDRVVEEQTVARTPSAAHLVPPLHGLLGA